MMISGLENKYAEVSETNNFGKQLSTSLKILGREFVLEERRCTNYIGFVESTGREDTKASGNEDVNQSSMINLEHSSTLGNSIERKSKTDLQYNSVQTKPVQERE